MPLLPTGPLTVHARPSNAPTMDDLLGRLTLDRLLVKVEAAVTGLLSNPLKAGLERDKVLAKADRGLDVDVAGGFKLRALDAVDGAFHLHLTPPIGHKGSSLHVALPSEGGEARAIVRTHPHAPDAPFGLYNLEAARGALAELDRIVCAAISAPDTKRVDRLRAEQIAERLGKALAHAGRLEEAIAEHPELSALARAAKLAYEVHTEGDATDKAYAKTVAGLRAFAESASLDPVIALQLERDLAVIAADREKWIAWRASTGIHTFYVSAY